MIMDLSQRAKQQFRPTILGLGYFYSAIVEDEIDDTTTRHNLSHFDRFEFIRGLRQGIDRIEEKYIYWINSESLNEDGLG